MTLLLGTEIRELLIQRGVFRWGRRFRVKNASTYSPRYELPELTGAVVFYEAQMYNPARLALAYLRSAADRGAAAANYVEAVDFLNTKEGISGVKARDVLSGSEFDVRATVTVNAAGPWASPLLRARAGLTGQPQPSFSRDAFFLVRGHLSGDFALGLPSRTKDRDAIVSRGSRHLFFVPWRNYTLVGVWHQVHRGSLDAVRLTTTEVQRFIDEINAVYPAARLELGRVTACNSGLILFGDERQKATEHSYARRSQLIDHAVTHQIRSLITVIGARYTTARVVAERVVDLVFQKLEKKGPRSATGTTPLHGGNIERFGDFLRNAIARPAAELEPVTISALAHNYGSEYHSVLEHADRSPVLKERLGASSVIKAEVVHGVREEMAQKLADIVFRRTELGTGEFPGDAALAACANVMATELGWDNSRLQAELEQTRAAFPGFTTENKQRTVA